MLLSEDDLWKVLSQTTQRTGDRRNREAKSTINLLVEDDRLIHIRKEDTATDMWTAQKCKLKQETRSAMQAVTGWGCSETKKCKSL